MIYTIIEYAATVSDVVFLIWFVPRFLHTRFYKRENLPMLAVPCLYLIAQLIADWFLPGFDLLAALINTGLALLYALLICRKKWFRAIIAGSAFILVVMLVSSVAYPLLSLAFGSGEGLMQGDQSPVRILYLVICKLAHFTLYTLLLILFKSDEDTDRKSGIIMLCYTVVSIGGLFALMTIAVKDTSRRVLIPTVALLFVLIFLNFGAFFLIRQIMKMQRKEYEFKLMKEKMNAEKQRAEDADAIWENIRKVRHDLRNHFTVIKGKLQEGEVKSCEEYIDEIYPAIESMGNLVHTGSAVIDYLINTKFSVDKEIQIIVSGFTEYFGDIEDADLTSMLGNILDNAFEAVEKISDAQNKRIELYFLKKNLNRIILCQNSIEGSVLQSNKELRSTKRGKDHGLGHRIVQTVTEKYGGFVE